MSVQFGIWNFDVRALNRDCMEKVSLRCSPYGPDGCDSYSNSHISVHHWSFHVTRESRQETQPHATSSGAVVTWDGRLDNRAEIVARLPKVINTDSPDICVVAAAYEAWNMSCFAKLVGDWAVSIWDPNSRSLILAKDAIGTQPLYYLIDKGKVAWSSILDPLVLCAEKPLSICEEYIAGCLSFFPAAHLTPYSDIQSVPPSSWVQIGVGKHEVQQYWDFDPSKRTRYKSDAEYEEHFRSVFAKAIQSRLRSNTPILTELSGGMDSSSIVCMADTLIAHGTTDSPRLDTVSYYDDSEPNWNELPYLSKVEAQRGRTGFHIDVGSQKLFTFEPQSDGFEASPFSSGSSNQSRLLAECLIRNGNRVVLSGIGGDEVLGGVPSATPELEDLLAKARFRSLAHELKVWALQRRKPWFHLLFEAVRRFLPLSLVGLPKHRHPPKWLNKSFIGRNRCALQGYETGIKLFGPLPTFQENLATLEVLRRQLACLVLAKDPPYEKRYPYLDRELLEFLFSIPREQLVRPGQRRSLMRRALSGIVPHEVLNRKRKGFISRSPRVAMLAERESLVEVSHDMVSALLGIVDEETFRETLDRAHIDPDARIIPLLRTAHIELWLRGLRNQQTGRLLSQPKLRFPSVSEAFESR
jgi:asparagine synthase (glutamine-hydrolysing)